MQMTHDCNCPSLIFFWHVFSGNAGKQEFDLLFVCLRFAYVSRHGEYVDVLFTVVMLSAPFYHNRALIDIFINFKFMVLFLSAIMTITKAALVPG